MDLTRREMMIASAAGSLLPATACAATGPGLTASPEAFGALGDGVTDDYAAFQRLAAAVNTARGGTITLRPGATYLLDRYISPNNGVSNVIFQGCSGLVVTGNGATIATKGDYFREARTTRGLAGLHFEDCANVQVRNIDLVGNVQLTRRANGVTEAGSHGLVFGGCSDVLVEGVLARHFAADGLYVRASLRGVGGIHRASRRFMVRNSRFLFNARQGLSVIQLRDAAFDGCEFSYTGYIDPQLSTGSYGNHAPSAGVDIEPDYTPFTPTPVDVLTGEITLRNCRMIGNRGAALSACQLSRGLPTIENVTVDGCTLEANEAAIFPYGLIFDVPGGAIIGSMLNMHNKTAVLGWYAESSASPNFSGNTVVGDAARSGQPLLVVRPTRGSPVIERNRFVDARPPTEAVRVGNPRTIMHGNQFASRP